jgi:hypothetical protein
MRRIKPTSDLAMKKVLTSKGNEDILCGLINDFFDIGAAKDEISIEAPYNIEAYKEYVNNMETRVLRQTVRDIAATFKRADFISELQIIRTKFFDERMLLYLFDRFRKNYNVGGQMELDASGKPNRYSSLIPVYSLNILGYTHYNKDDDALRIFELFDPTRNKGFGKDLIKMGVFELTKPNIETPNQRHWRDYLLTGDVRADAPDYLRKASRIIKLDNLDEEERRMATIYELADEAWENDVSGAWLQGKDDGKALGIAEGRILGIAEGEAIGIAKGEINSKIEDTVNMIKELGVTLSKAMSITRLPESARGRLMDELKRLQLSYRA